MLNDKAVESMEHFKYLGQYDTSLNSGENVNNILRSKVEL